MSGGSFRKRASCFRLSVEVNPARGGMPETVLAGLAFSATDPTVWGLRGNPVPDFTFSEPGVPGSGLPWGFGPEIPGKPPEPGPESFTNP
ncbi:hypothetical protein AGMMS49991_05400 [Spirochaetia bacterium]|nr:hypothetical protein AGMMS49991_05400 [Spirochaetia bacterium]